MKICRRTLSIFILALMVIPSLSVLALQFDETPVTTSTYVDTDAQVWGTNIVWRRGVDLDMDGLISYKEPSWIMLKSVATDEEWTISEDYSAGLRLAPDLYYHAESPSINGNHIIYHNMYADDSWEVHMNMYNISTTETWDFVPFSTTSNSWCSGMEAEIYGDWIMYSHWGSTKSLYIYNFETGEGRTLELTVNTGGFSMTNDYMVYTEFLTAPTTSQIYVYNIGTMKTIGLNYADKGAVQIRSGYQCIYGDMLGLRLLDASPSSWNTYLLDMSGWNWTAIIDAESYNWAYVDTTRNINIQDNTIVVDIDSTYDSFTPLIWENYVFYIKKTGTIDYDIVYYNIAKNETEIIVETPYNSQVTDIYIDKLVWQDTRNSFTQNGDLTDNWDIYRMVTDVESIGSSLSNVVPLILIMLVSMSIIGAFMYFGNSADGGMI